jgi:hypothetical protein
MGAWIDVSGDLISIGLEWLGARKRRPGSDGS